MATTLSIQISAIATQVGTDIKAFIANVGDLSQLTTTQKASLVVALNELNATLQKVQDSLGAQINDSATSLTTTWSSTKIMQQISASISGLVDGAPDTLDTLKELASAIESNGDAISALQTIAAGHVKYDAAQSLTSEQQAQARTNIGAASGADVTALKGTVTALQGTVSENTTDISQNTSAIGTLTSLNTSAKTNLVAAINEANTNATNAKTAASQASQAASGAQNSANAAQTTATNAQSAVNALSQNVGDTQADFVAIYTAARDGTASSF